MSPVRVEQQKGKRKLDRTCLRKNLDERKNPQERNSTGAESVQEPQASNSIGVKQTGNVEKPPEKSASNREEKQAEDDLPLSKLKQTTRGKSQKKPTHGKKLKPKSPGLLKKLQKRGGGELKS